MNEVIEQALTCYDQGWVPIPIKPKSKRPASRNWQKTKYRSRNDIEEAFEDNNVGLLLGAASENLIDIDIDSPVAEALALGVLPSTRMMHGRESHPQSHFWYLLDRLPEYKKFTDPEDGEALLEIRAKGQTVIPPSVHPSGEDYVWYEGWHPPAQVEKSELIPRCYLLAAISLLAKHWPGEGSRHDASLALVGGLVRDEHYDEDTIIGICTGVMLGADDEEAMERVSLDVPSTVEKHKKNKRFTGWKSLTNFVPSKVVKQAREWLNYDDGIGELLDSDEPKFPRTDLSDYVTLNAPKIPELVEGIIYEGKVHWIQGEPGKGKTIFALHLAVEIMKNGGRVMLVDEESGAAMTGTRLASLGATAEMVENQFFYYQHTGIDVTDVEYRELFTEQVNLYRPNVVMFDSVADIMAQAGLEENNNDHVNAFIKGFVDPIRQGNTATLFIDHLAKMSEGGQWARGAGSKKAKTDVAWTFSAIREFNQNTIGYVSLKRAKDRLGQMPATHAFNMGGKGDGLIHVNKSEVVKGFTAPQDRYTQRIIEYLKSNHDTDQTVIPSTELVKAIKGKTDVVRKALKWCEDHITELPIEYLSEGNARLWYYSGDTDMEIDFTITEN